MTGSASGSGGSGGSGAGPRGGGGGAGASASGTSGGSSGSGSTSTACAACKYQRRKCTPDCPLSPYFPPDQPRRFQNVHKLFGVSNILRILKHVDPSKREDTVKSISYEADTREKDPVHGCLGVITILQNQVYKLKDELAVAREQLFLLQQQQQQHNFNQQVQMPPIVSSLGGSTSIVSVSSAQDTNVLMQNFQSYNDMTDFAKGNALPISPFEPDQFLRNDGFDQINKPGGGASSSRFDMGRYIREESPGHHQTTAPLPGAVKQEPQPPEPHLCRSMHHHGDHNQILQDMEQPFDTPVDPFAMAMRRRGPGSGFLNLTVASESDLRRRAAARGHHGVSEHELRSAGVYLTLTTTDRSPRFLQIN